MTERSWRENLPDLRQLGLWVMERGVKMRAKEQVQTFRLEVAGAAIDLIIGRHVSVEMDRCQLHIRDVHSNWKGALGFVVPHGLTVEPGVLTPFGGANMPTKYEGITHRPFTFAAMKRLDDARKPRKASPYANQHDMIYFAYWYLIYGEMVGHSMFNYPADPSNIFNDKMEDIYNHHSVPHTYLNDPTGKFPRDFLLAKMVSDAHD